MENTEKSEMPENPKKNSSFKIMAVILALVVAVLVWQLIITKTKVNTFTVEKEKTQLKNISLQKELDSLVTEHEKIKTENSTMSGKLSEQDSLITAKADEIQQLIASQADYSRIKKKLEYLRGITQGYVTKIDSLYTVNKVLKEENTEIKDKFEKEQTKSTELAKDKENLSQKVSLASTLKAYNIKGTPIRMKSTEEVPEEKAKRAERIKVSFTLSENLIAPSGLKTIYVRLAGPDEKILTVSEDDENAFSYNGERLQFSMKEDIDYENKAQNIAIYWDKTAEFVVGTYYVSVFTDGILIGESQFTLK